MSRAEKKAKSRAEKRRQKKNNKMSIWKRILLGLFAVILAGGVGGAGLFAYYATNAPELTQEDLTGAYGSDFVDMNNEIFYTLGGEEREYAEADDYPQVMLDAIMAIEDTRFERHLGIDPIGISRAALGYLTNAGEIVGGGSTITQQLIKLSVFSTTKADQTLERKAQEAWLALQLERQLSKEQIMTLYLNRIHMGSNVYGVATAAKEYYGKDVSELELHEAAMFAAMPKGPNLYNPYVDPEAATNRRNLVLNEMVEFGAITQEEADRTKEIPVEEGLLERNENPDNLVFDGYLTAALEEIEEKTDYDPYTAGLTIYTNYDPDAQELLYDVVNSDDYVNFPNDELQTAVTLVDTPTGKLTAVIGGRKFDGQLSMNRATRNRRSVGSTMKPLTTYGPAIEFEQFSTYHQIVDEPYSAGDWSPMNYDRAFRGQMSIRDALVDSRNIPAAKIFNEDLNLGDVENFLTRLGIDASKVSPDGLVRSSALDGAMSPLELTGAYAAIANQGNFTKPYAVTKIVNQRGDETNLVPQTSKAMEDYTAYMLTDMLKGVVPYYGSELSIPGYIHAAKTGTTNYDAKQMAEYNIPSGGVPDNWVVGYSPYYTMGVWVGYDQFLKEGNYLTFADGSRRLPRHIYREAMSRLVSDFEQRDWQRPDTVVELSIEKGSMPALLAAPGSSNAVKELFVKGSSSIPSKKAEPEYTLGAPSGLSAEYLEEEDAVNITWDAYELPEGVNDKVDYILTINGREENLSGTGAMIENPPRTPLDISVAIRVDNETGPAASIQFTIPELPDPDEEENDEEEEPEEEVPTEEEPPVEEPEEEEEEPPVVEDEEETEENP